MTINAYNLIILLGAVHGVVLAMLLVISRRNNKTGNLLLAAMLLLYTLPVLRSVLHELGFFQSYQFWFLNFELLYGLGPSLYLYSKIVSDSDFRLSRLDLLHFLPVFLELCYYVSPLYQQQRHFSFGAPQDSAHLIWMIEQVGGIASILIYFGLTNRLLWQYSRWVKAHYSDTSKRALSWLQLPVLLYTVFFILWFALRGVDVFRYDDSLGNNAYYPLLIFLSFSTYWIGTRGYLEVQTDASGFNKTTTDQSIASVGDEDGLTDLFNALEATMSKNKLFLENDLSLSELADVLQVNPRRLSKAINDKAKMNFYDYVNSFRISEFKSRISELDSGRTILELAFECGFGSKATFNHVFKKVTGETPSTYKARMQQSKD